MTAEIKQSKDQRIVKAAIATVLLVILILSAFYDPVYYKITDCFFKNKTGLSCPGCGISRSFHSTANLEIAEAFTFHLLGPIFFIVLLLISLLYYYEAISGNKKGMTIKNRKVVVIAFFSIWFVYWIVRMIEEVITISIL